MGKIKFSLETKIKACKEYEQGDKSYTQIAKEIGAGKSTVSQWYAQYKKNGIPSLKEKKPNKSFSKQFKENILKEYLTGNYSNIELATKYNISHSTTSKWINMWYNGIEFKDTKTSEDKTMNARKTTYKERLEIVEWVINNNKDYKKAVEKYGINYALIYKWTRDYLKNGKESLEYKKRGPKGKTQKEESNLTELDKLKLELKKEKELRKRVEFELEVFKKKEQLEKQLYTQKYVKKQNTKQ